MSVRSLTRQTLIAWALVILPGALAAQRPTGREAVEALTFEELRFTPPEPARHEVMGVTVLHLEDHTLPLVTVSARFRGGYGMFEREWYAPAMGLPALLRYGGTTALAPDSVDQLLEFYAIQASFETGGGSIASRVNTVTQHLPATLDLWREMLTSPRFDEDEIGLWRGRELERAARRLDDPSALAFARFNELMYGDHSIGWEMGPEDLQPELVTPERFRTIHRRIICRENLILGVTGDVSWTEALPELEQLVSNVPPCEAPLPEAPLPDIRRDPGTFLIERPLEQAVIVMAQPTSVRLADDPTYFAATVGNSVLGGGGFSSRILQRVRTDEGFAYSASSLWTTPRRHDGLLGAVTSTRPENAVPAIRVILGTMEELTRTPPTGREVQTTVDRVVNGWVFNYRSAQQIVEREMGYELGDVPADWLERYAEGIQAVTPSDVRDVFAAELRPDLMTLLVVGDPRRIDMEALEELGPVTVLEAQ